MAVSPVDPSSLLAEMIDSEMFTTFPGGFAYRYQFGPLETIRDGVPREIAEWAQREADWLTVEVLNAGNAGNVRGGPLFA